MLRPVNNTDHMQQVSLHNLSASMFSVCATACRLAAKPLLQHLDQVQTQTLPRTQTRLLTHSLLQLSKTHRQCKVRAMQKSRGKKLHQVCVVYTVCMSSID